MICRGKLAQTCSSSLGFMQPLQHLVLVARPDRGWAIDHISAWILWERQDQAALTADSRLFCDPGRALATRIGMWDML